MAFKFEKLAVWERAFGISGRVHEVVKMFPDHERYVLTSQMQRAADSITLNIAEGSTGQTNAEFKQFIGYAIRSALELGACLYLARQRLLIKQDAFRLLYDEVEQLVRMLQALRRSISSR